MPKHQIELYKSKNGFRLKIFAPNGREILANGQGISNKADLIECFDNLVKAIKADNFEFHDLEEKIDDTGKVNPFDKNISDYPFQK